MGRAVTVARTDTDGSPEGEKRARLGPPCFTTLTANSRRRYFCVALFIWADGVELSRRIEEAGVCAVRTLIKVAVGSALLSAGLIAPAQGATDSVEGSVCACRTWANYGNVRTHAVRGNITMRMTDLTASGTEIRLISADGASQITDPRKFREKTLSIIGYDVQARTRFRLSARPIKDINRTQDDTWKGRVSY